MTTIIDALGTPVPVYNRSGTAIVELSAPFTNPRTTVSIPSVAQTTIAWIEADYSGTPSGGQEPWAELPASAEIGDVVEVYIKPTALQYTGVTVVPAAGDVVYGSTQFGLGNGGVRVRKVGPNEWYKSSN